MFIIAPICLLHVLHCIFSVLVLCCWICSYFWGIYHVPMEIWCICARIEL
jgi:hypothetical protein